MNPDTVVLTKEGVQQLLAGVPKASDQEPNSYLMLLALGLMVLCVVAALGFLLAVIKMFLKQQAQQNAHVNEAISASAGAVERGSHALEQNGVLFERCTTTLARIANGGSHA